MLRLSVTVRALILKKMLFLSFKEPKCSSESYFTSIALTVWFTPIPSCNLQALLICKCFQRHFKPWRLSAEHKSTELHKYNPLSTVQDMTHWGEGFRIENLEVDSKGIYKLDFITHYVRNLEPTRWGHVALSWRINIEGRGDAQNSIGGDFKLTQIVFNAPFSWGYSTIGWCLFWLVFVTKYVFLKK